MLWSAIRGYKLIPFHWFRLELGGNMLYVDTHSSPLALCVYRSIAVVLF